MSVSPRKMGKRTCTISQTYMLDYQFAMLNASPPHGEGARYLTISFYVALLFTVFALHKVSCYSFIQRTGRAMA